MACISEGEVPASGIHYQLTGSEDDAGITARLAKRLIAWTSADAGKLEVIRPGTFTAQYIRSTGLKSPVLIKGDRFNESPQLGLMWPDVHNISVDVLSDYIGGDRKVDTWDVMKQRPGPAWTLSQWCTYWHARLDAATRQAKPATAHGAPGMLVADDDDEDGEVVDSGVVIVLQGVQGVPHSKYNPAPACVGISPEQARRLLDGECLPLHGSQLCQHIHPPPAVISVDLVRQVEKDLETFLSKEDTSKVPAKSDAAGRAAGASVAAGETSREGGSSMHGRKKDEGKDKKPKFSPLSINPADTLHLQMSPQDCFSDFRMAPGGAATWLYVLKGLKVVILIPPTIRNRRLFLTWSTATRANQPKENVLVECLLADYAEGAVKVELKASQALVIPAGWFYASAAPTDTLAVGCYFWHPYCLADSARVQQMELQLKLKPQRFSLPARNLLWYAGVAYGFKLRREYGLPELVLQKPADPAASARRSVSEASLNQRQRTSPYLRPLSGSAAAAAAGGEQQQRRRLVRGAGGSVTPGSTPPMLGLQSGSMHQQADSFGGLRSPMGDNNKRGRQSDVMEHLCLGDSAVPVAAAGAAEGQQQQQAPKRIKLSTGKPTTPLMNGLPGAAAVAAGVTASTVSTPRCTSHAQQPGVAALGAIPSNSNQSGRLLHQQNGAAGPAGQRQQQQHQMRTPGKVAGANNQRKYASAVDDDDDGECHTSPVRRPEPDPVQDPVAGDGYVEWAGAQQQQQQWGAAAAGDALRAITALKIKVPGKAQPMYSPVIQPLTGDLDSVPALVEQQQQPTAVTPTAAAIAAVRKAAGPLPPPAAAAATPGRKKLTLKGQATPTTAAAGGGGGNSAAWPNSSPAAAVGVQPVVRRKSSPDQDSSAGSHAVSAEHTLGTNTSSGQQQQGAGASKSQQQQQQRKMVLEPTSDDEDDPQQQPLKSEQQSMQMPPAAPAAQQRRVSESGVPRPTSAAAGAGAKAAPLKLKFKLASPSPKLAALQAPQNGAGVPPVLSLDGQAPGVVPQPQQQQFVAPTVPQVDGAMDDTSEVCAEHMVGGVEQAVLQGQMAMQQLLQRQQQQQAGLWVRWQQLQSTRHSKDPSRQISGCNAAPAAAAAAVEECGHSIPQVDGAGEDGRPAHVGPTLVLQPAAASPVTAVSQAAATPVATSGGQPLSKATNQQQNHVNQVVMVKGDVPAGQQHAVGFLSPGKVPQQLHVPLQDVTHTAARPPTAKLQPQPLGVTAKNHAVAAVPPTQQQQQVVPAAVAGVQHVQQGLVIPKNPVLQPQVQKLRSIGSGKAGSPDSGSPKDKSADAAVGQQQQQNGRLAAVVSPPLASPSAAADAEVADMQVDPQGLRLVPSFTCWAGESPQLAAVDAVVGAAAARAASAAGSVPQIPVGGCSRAGSNSFGMLGSTAAAAAVGLLNGHTPVLRRTSMGITGENTAATPRAAVPRTSPPAFNAAAPAAVTALVPLPAAAAAGSAALPQQQQQPGAMGPPPPTKLSTWELVEMPMVVELLHEQVVEKVCECPINGLDPELVLQQLHEAVVELRKAKDGDPAPAGQLQHSQQQQLAVMPPPKPLQQQVSSVSEAAISHLQQERGPLVVLPFTQDEMPAGFLELCRQGQQLLRANGALLGAEMEGVHETTTEVVGDHDPHEGSIGAGSLDNRSAGSIGVSRGVGAAAAGARVGDAAVGGRHQQVKRGPSSSAVPLGVQQAKNIKKQQVLKGIGIKR